MDCNLQHADLDLHRKITSWDQALPIAAPPSWDSLVEFLCRRLVPSHGLDLVKRVVRVVIRLVLYLLGFEDAHHRIQNDHQRDAVSCCWYCPKMSNDRFGIRPGEPYLDGNTLPPQVQMSYGIVIRGIRSEPKTSVLDGLGQDVIRDDMNSDNGNTSNGKVYPGRSLNEASSPMLHRATSLIISILKAREFYRGAEFSPDTYKDKPLTMQWYSCLFSTSIQYHGELIERYTAPRAYSRHIVVMCRGRAYYVEIIRKDVMGDEVMPTYEEIKRQLERIMLLDSRSVPSLNVSAITTLSAADRYSVEQSLKEVSDRNRYNFAAIRDSLLVISLDPGDAPRTANDTLFLLQAKNCDNRWYDRSVNVVVFGNGVAGFVMNYLAGMTGTVASSFVQLVKDKEEETLRSLQQVYMASHDQIKLKELKAPSLLMWDDNASITMEIQRIVDSQTGESGPFVPCYPAMFKLSCDVTRKDLIDRGVSPCGAFQAALQIALVRICGRATSVYEIISIRNLQFGGLAWMETNTADMRSFVIAASEFLSEQDSKSSKRVLKDLLHRATASYRNDVIRHKQGEVNLWHIDSIYRQLGLLTRLPRPRNKPRNLRSIIQQPIVDYLRRPLVNLLPPSKAETLTSNPSWNPAIEAVGRVGVKSMLPLSVHYLFSNTSVAITVNTSTKHPCHGKEKQFAKELGNALSFIKKLLDDAE